MVQFDNQYRQIKVKVVYYGPAQGGKTTCLQHIHRVTDPQRRTKLYSLNTASDRTLFFDLLSLQLGRIRGYRVAVQLYTVPGQVQYNATRRAVLSSADGVVFVADSQLDQRQANLESLGNLRDNLAANGLDLDTIPLVFQYNKQDLAPLLTTDQLEQELNHRTVPSFPTVAITGEGVMDAFAAIAEQSLSGVAERLGVGASELAIRRLQNQVQEALQPFLRATGAPGDGADVEVTTPVDRVAPGQPLEQEALVGEAVRANLAMTDLNTRLETVSRQLERKVSVLASIAEFGREVSRQHDPRLVLRALLDRAVDVLELGAAAVLLVPRSGPLQEALLDGVDRDPLLGTADEAGQPLAAALVEGRQPRLLARDLQGEGGGFFLEAIEAAGFGSAVVVPMVVQDRIVGLLAGYSDRERPPLDEDDLQLAVVLASTAAIAHAGAEAWHQLEGLNRDLGAQVSEGSQRLDLTLGQLQQLADDLQDKNRLLEGAYRELAELDRVKDDLIARLSRSLKGPASAVLNAARLLAADPDATGTQRDARFVTIIRDEAEKLSELIQGVVQASLLAGDGDRRADLEEVPLEDLLRRALAPLHDLARHRGVRLNILIPSGLKAIRCECASTEEALRAVVKNAIEYSRGGGSVKLEVRRLNRQDGTWLALRVADSGVGIAEQDLGRVFDTFWQGGSAPGDRPRGLGLGLTIAKRMVERQGGTIAITSRPDEGTEVTMSLPQRAG